MAGVTGGSIHACRDGRAGAAWLKGVAGMCMVWFRIMGAGLMTLGAALATATVVLAAILAGNFIEWTNAASALPVALITVPAGLLGVGLIGLGRLVYGQWLDRAPLRRIAALIVQAVGALTTLGLGVLFLLLIMAGVGPQDRTDATNLGLGMLAGLALLFLGVWLRPRSSMREHD
jgi:hypothetical protein